MKQFPYCRTPESFDMPRCVINLQNAVWYAMFPRLNEPWKPHLPPPLMDHLLGIDALPTALWESSSSLMNSFNP